jgi:hypothetical protein
VVEAAVLDHRPGGPALDHAAVDVQMTADLDGLDEQGQRDRAPDHVGHSDLRRARGAEVLDPPEVHVVDDAREGNRRVPAEHVGQAGVEEALDRLALRQAGEAAQRGERELGELRPLDVEVVLRRPRERELRHLVRGHPGSPHRTPERAAGAADDLGRLDARLLERPGHADQRDGRPAATGCHQRHALALELGDGPLAQRLEDVGGIDRLLAVDDREREHRAAHPVQEAEVGRDAGEVDDPVEVLELRLDGVEIEAFVEARAHGRGTGR